MDRLKDVRERWARVKDDLLSSYSYSDRELISSIHVDDVAFLLKRIDTMEGTLIAAEISARNGFQLGRLDTLNNVVENLQMYVDELKTAAKYAEEKRAKTG